MKNPILFFATLAVALLPLAALSDLSNQNCEVARTDDSCMICNMYHEARSETERGLMAVAFVTLNRVASPEYPNTICEVVWQRGWSRKHKRWFPQFSWTMDGKSDFMKEVARIRDIQRIYYTLKIAYDLEVEGVLVGIPRSTLWYHTGAVNPSWSQKFTQVAMIGDHQFYQKD